MTDVLTTIFVHASLFLLLPNMRPPQRDLGDHPRTALPTFVTSLKGVVVRN